ncbi:MAG: sulfurtransferase [Cyanobacteria bacterium QS_8_64_29]|nr:MAG: sulfurtransferase [Cyanobacteria bacterium QS_8_64_29]
MTDIISRDELKAQLDHGEPLILIDTLPEQAYRKHHLPGAINIPSDDINQVAPQRLPDKNAPIVVYCANGPCKRSQRAWERLKALGYTQVWEYDEGREDWVAAGLPVESADA